jgi:5,6-dimethylbenzimidazole synthase
MPETAIYSAVCAVQNLWLAARAEGIGVGWVSILDPEALKVLLGIPAHMVLVAYLCLGYVDGFQPKPELERVGWEQRVPLAEVIRLEHFDGDKILAEQSR